MQSFELTCTFILVSLKFPIMYYFLIVALLCIIRLKFYFKRKKIMIAVSFSNVKYISMQKLNRVVVKSLFSVTYGIYFTRVAFV